jgi:drug/metabolite transporter (DMT)-like permease
VAPVNQIGLREWGLLVLLSVIWGGSYLFIGIAVKDLSPLVIVMARVILAAAGLLVLLIFTGAKLPRGRSGWTTVLGMAVLNNVIPFTLIVTGQTMIASGLASVINATTPLFGVAFLAMAGLEPLAVRRVTGLVVGVIGVAVLKGGTMLGAGSQSLGILLCLGAAASYGLTGLWAKKRLKGIPPLSAATGQLLCSAAIMTVLAFAFDDPATLLNASVASWIALLGLSLIATSLAYLIFFRVIERAGPANVLLVTMMIPASAIVMGYVVLHETLEAREVAGALIIIAALVIIDGRVLRLLRQRDTAA